MNRSERALKYQMIDDTSIEIFKRTLRIRSIHNEYRKNILKNLIDIYYENYEGETLEKYLIRLDIRLLGSEERGSIIEYYIQRGFYEKAYEAISEYGYEDIRDKRLMRLCSRMIRKRNYEADELLLEIAFSAFKAGKYDEVILEYLNRYYLGTTKDYLDIWKAAGGFEVEAISWRRRCSARCCLPSIWWKKADRCLIPIIRFTRTLKLSVPIWFTVPTVI